MKRTKLDWELAKADRKEPTVDMENLEGDFGRGAGCFWSVFEKDQQTLYRR